MKKKLFCLLFVFMLPIVGQAEQASKDVTVNAKNNCTFDRLTPPSEAVSISLLSGKYLIKPTGGGWSSWSSDSKAPPDIQGPWTWLVYYSVDDGRTKCIGECGDFWVYQSKEDANVKVNQFSSQPVQLEKDGQIKFWVFDSHCEDNRGEVKLSITPDK